MAHMKSLWPRLAELPLVVESCKYDRLHAVLSHEFERVTTHVRLVGAGADGLGRGRLGPRRGRQLAARDAARAAARGRVDARRLLRSPRNARPVVQAAGVGAGAALSQLGVRVGGAGPRVAPGGPCPTRRARPRAAAGALRQLAGPRRAALDRARAPAARPLARRALQARRGGDLVARTRRRGRGDRRGRHDRLQRPVRARGEGPGGAGRAVRPRARGVPGRVPGGSARPARDRAAARRSRRARLLRRADPERRGHRRDAASRARGERQAVAHGQPASALRGVRALRAGAAADVRRRNGELGVGRGQIELLAALFHADAPNDVAPSAYNEDDPADELPASPLAPRPDAVGFRWTP